MKIIIIGSSGFIGSQTYFYFEKEHEVWGADIIKPKLQQNFILLNALNTDYNELWLHKKFDLCINASGNGSVPVSLNLPLFDFELNVTNTIKILDSIRIYNAECKFINLSSAAVYGNPKFIPVREDSNTRPLSPYGWHKLYAEEVCKEYYYLYNIRTINLRLFSVFGPYLRKQLFWDLFQKCQRSKIVELFGTGQESRDFIYIDDLLQAIKLIIDNSLFNGEAINIASGIETKISDAALQFCKLFDPELEIRFNNIVKPGDPLNWKADISTLSSFNFKVSTSLETGINQTLKWLKENA